MACSGCKKSKRRFKERLMKEKAKEQVKRNSRLSEQEITHFMNVCIHGVPNGRPCGGCNKIISIPEDAVIKPDVVDKVDVINKVE